MSSEGADVTARLGPLNFSIEEDGKLLCIKFPVNLAPEERKRVGPVFQSFSSDQKPLLKPAGKGPKDVAKIALNGCDVVDCAIAALCAIYQWPSNSLDRADIQKRITEQKFGEAPAPAPSPQPVTKAETVSSEAPQKTENDKGGQAVEIDKSLLDPLQFSTETENGDTFFLIHFPVNLTPEERKRVGPVFQAFSSDEKPMLRQAGKSPKVMRIVLNGCDVVDCTIAALCAIYQWPPNSLDRADIQKRITEQKFEEAPAPAPAPSPQPVTKAETVSSEPPQKTEDDKGEQAVEIDKSLLDPLQFSTETENGKTFFLIHFPVDLAREDRNRVSPVFQDFSSDRKPMIRSVRKDPKNVARIVLNGCDVVDCAIAALCAIYQWPPNSLDRADIQKRITEQKFEEAPPAPAPDSKPIPSLDNIDFRVIQTAWVRETKVRFPDPVPEDILNRLDVKFRGRRETLQRNPNDPCELITRAGKDPYESIRLIVVSVLNLKDTALTRSDIQTLLCRRSANKVSYSSESRGSGKVGTTLFLVDEMIIDMNDLKREMTKRECAVRALGPKQISIVGNSATQADDVCACLEFLYHGQPGALNKDEVKKWLVERDHAYQKDPNLPVVQVSAAALMEICQLLGLPNLKASLTLHF